MIRLFRVSIPTSVLLLLLGDFVLVCACLTVGASIFVIDNLEIFLLYDDGLVRLGIVAVSVIAAFYFNNLYSDFTVRSPLILLHECIFALGIALVSQAIVGYVFPGWIAPRSVLLFAAFLFAGLFPLWRICYQRFFMRALGMQTALFLGANSLAQDLAARFTHQPHLGMRGLGFVVDEHDIGSEVATLKVLGPISSFSSIVEANKPDLIIIGLTERRQILPLEDLLSLRFSGIQIKEAATAFQSAFSRIPVRGLRHSQLIFSDELGPLPGSVRLQTLYSIVFAAVALALVSPIILLVALLVRLTSAGPILFRQTRVGLHGKPFNILKFRSMVVNAEQGTGAVWASRNDPRVTFVGGYLRKTRLDELPQLYNVLRGEMSIVGPRPERPEFVKTLTEMIPFYAHRHSVKPGITGWAQINYKYGESIEDTVVKLEYDLYYIKNLSPALDFYIMFHTVKAMLMSHGGQ